MYHQLQSPNINSHHPKSTAIIHHRQPVIHCRLPSSTIHPIHHQLAVRLCPLSSDIIHCYLRTARTPAISLFHSHLPARWTASWVFLYNPWNTKHVWYFTTGFYSLNSNILGKQTRSACLNIYGKSMNTVLKLHLRPTKRMYFIGLSSHQMLYVKTFHRFHLKKFLRWPNLVHWTCRQVEN